MPRSHRSGAHEIIAVLDDAADSWGRSVNGVRVMGSSSELESIIEEFGVHGVHTDRVVAGIDPGEMPDQVLEEIRHICARHNIELGFVPELFGLTNAPAAEARSAAELEFDASLVADPPLELPAYFAVKRYLDFVAALALLIVLGPLWLIASSIAMVDVGQPVFFWQQRMGVGGRRFLLHKFRTLRIPFDETGRNDPVERAASDHTIGLARGKSRRKAASSHRRCRIFATDADTGMSDPTRTSRKLQLH
jgi:Bacterial sugar transferase